MANPNTTELDLLKDVTVSGGSVDALVVSGTVTSVPSGTQTVTGTVTANQGTGGVSAWKVDGSAVTQPVSGSVSVSNFPATQPVSGSVTVTQVTGTNLHAVVDSGTISTITNVVHVDDNGGSLTVDGTVAATQSGTWTVQPGNTANTTAWKVDGSAVTQPVSGTVAVSSQPNFTDGSTVSSSISGVQTASVSCSGASIVGVQITGTWTGSIVTEATIDGSTYYPLIGYDLNAFNTTGGSVDDTITSGNIFQFPVAGFASFRLRANGITGTAVVSMKASNGTALLNGSIGSLFVSGSVSASQSGTWNVGLNASTNSIGKLAANSGVDIGDVTINNASGAAAVNIQDGGNSITVDGTISAAQSGTWTVTGAGGTFPVTDSGGSLTVDNSGTFSVQSATVALGTPSLTDAASSALSIDTYGNLRVRDSEAAKQTDLLRNLIQEVRAMRLAVVALATDGNKYKDSDFDPEQLPEYIVN